MFKKILGTLRGRESNTNPALAGEVRDDIVSEGRRSFAQAGEDMIVDFIFRAIGIDRPNYLDIGAHHPTRLSNTHFFYTQGCRGVNVEPDPDLFDAFLVKRPEDVNLNVGIGEGNVSALPFHVMSTRTLNTFSSAEAARYEGTGLHRVEKIIEVPVVSINTVIETHFGGASPDFVSVDVEGLDIEIVKSLDLKRFRPAVICVETLTFSETREEEKIPEIGDYLAAQGYFAYADTYINTLFVDRARWKGN
ncbi:FkbM family methyltransferase [Cupriavidus sp. KB_39]|jgi:FkbM family methyltransferase|uniref:FkbM family methyltransferase n=1 Tax=Cupriavidus sp. KB_39 TaxID=3233036 RepID=UPI003F93C9B7